MSVSFDWYSPEAGMQVGWICTKHGFAKYAPRFAHRHAAVTFELPALVER